MAVSNKGHQNSRGQNCHPSKPILFAFMLMENYVCHNIFYPLNNSFCPQDSIPPLKNFAPWQMNAFLIRGNTHILCLELPLHNPIADQENKTFAPSSEVIAQEITCKDILFIFEKLIVLKRVPTPYQHQETPSQLHKQVF